MKGTWSVVVITLTPFDEQGRLDEAAYRTHLRRLRDAGVTVFVAGSGSSEAYSFSPEEFDRVLQISVEELKGHVPFRAMGCEPHLPAEMVEFLRRAERAKVDAAQIFSLDIGHGRKPITAELERYYNTAIESTALPIYLSSHRAAGYWLPIELVERLVDRFPQIAGINYAGTDTYYVAELIRRLGDRIEIHCAGPTNALTVLGLGGNGFMGGEGNFMPELVQAVIEAYRADDRNALRRSFAHLMGFSEIYERNGGSSMRGLKPLNNHFGLPGGTLRPPRLPISAAETEKMVKEIQAIDLPGLPPMPKRAGG